MLRLSGITAGYSRVTVLRDVDMVVPTGAAVALLGANGAGKTTLLRVAAGLLEPMAGAVELDGVDVTRQPASARSRAGLCLVPEGRGVYPHLTVRENLAMQVRGRDVAAAVADATTFFPVLGQRLDQPAGTLSGGEQQMLAVSRVLVAGPSVILADELSLGLAPRVIDQIFEALRAALDAGRSLLVVEQYAQRVLRFVDYTYVLGKGEVVFVGERAQCAGPDFERHLHLGQAS